MIDSKLSKLLWGIRFLFFNVRHRKFKIGYLGRPLFICGASNIFLESGVGIFPAARLECLNTGTIHIGKNSRFGHNLFFSTTSSKITVGENCIFSSNVYAGTQLYNFNSQRISVNWFREASESPIKIGNNCFIGINVVILPGTTIGDNSTIGANCIISGNIPHGSLIKNV